MSVQNTTKIKFLMYKCISLMACFHMLRDIHVIYLHGYASVGFHDCVVKPAASLFTEWHGSLHKAEDSEHSLSRWNTNRVVSLFDVSESLFTSLSYNPFEARSWVCSVDGQAKVVFLLPYEYQEVENSHQFFQWWSTDLEQRAMSTSPCWG